MEILEANMCLCLSFALYKFKRQSKIEMSQVDSFIEERKTKCFIRFMRAIDIFSFIPVPKDENVSTKQSVIGSVIFILLFLSYIIYDFVQFATNNPLVEQNYRTPLDTASYTLPNFSIAFMTGNLTNETSTYDDTFTYNWQLITKAQGSQTDNPLDYTLVTYQNGVQTNFDSINWMNEATKRFYYVLRTNSQPSMASGLLYSSETATYARVKASYCVNSTSNNNSCATNDTLNNRSNYGRFFLFIQNQPDTSSVSRQTALNNGNNYLLYNFFVIPGFYKRININFVVVKTQILPDYLRRWSTESNTRILVESVFQEISVVTFNSSNTDAIAFNMQLSPNILNNRISCSTLLDHVSLWGAFWGVLFAAFALFFLSYNRRKFYEKNPKWNQFKKVVKGVRLVQSQDL